MNYGNNKGITRLITEMAPNNFRHLVHDNNDGTVTYQASTVILDRNRAFCAGGHQLEHHDPFALAEFAITHAGHND